MSLSSQQYQSLRDLNTAVSSLSIVGSLFVLGVYLFGGTLRSYPLRLVCYMAISNLALSITYVSAYEVTTGNGCTVQAFMINVSQLSSLLWTTVFSFCLLISIRERDDDEEESRSLQSYEWMFLLVGYGVPLLLSVIPIFGGIYTQTMYYCWIGFSNEAANIIQQLVEFYIPLVAAMVFNLYATIRIRQFQKQHDNGTETALKYLGRLYVYPLILIISWSPKLVTRALHFAGIELFWLDIVDITFGGLLGLANSVAYGTNKAVINRIRSAQCCQSPSQTNCRQSLHNTIQLAEKQGPYRTKSKSDHGYNSSSVKMTVADRKYSTEV